MARALVPLVGAVTLESAFAWPCCRCCRDERQRGRHDAPYVGHEHPCARCQADQLVIGVGE